MSEPTAERLDGRTVMALVAMVLAVFLIANDITSLTVALPTIEHDFHAGCQEHSRSVASSTAKPAAGTRALAADDVPVRRWQLWQWQ